MLQRILGIALALELSLTAPALTGQGKTELPIGGHSVLDPSDAAEATRMIRPHFAIPMHYGTTPQLAGTPEEYVAALGKTATEVKAMQPGETTIFDGP